MFQIHVEIIHPVCFKCPQTKRILTKITQCTQLKGQNEHLKRVFFPLKHSGKHVNEESLHHPSRLEGFPFCPLIKDATRGFWG